MDEAASTPDWQRTTNHPIDGLVLYHALGIYQTQEQVDNTPHLDNAKPGDLIYQDTNGDGKLHGMMPSESINRLRLRFCMD